MESPIEINDRSSGKTVEPNDFDRLSSALSTQSSIRFLAVILLSLIPALAARAQFLYRTNLGGTTITIYGYNGSGGDVVVPAVINGLPVTVINDLTFFEKYSITSITISNGIESIGNQAFAGCEATNIVIPPSVTNLGDSVFSGCAFVTNFTWPSNVATLSDGAFMQSGLKKITIPDGVTFISGYAFDGCINLKSVTIPASVTNIANPFEDCTNLQWVFFLGNAPSVYNALWNENENPTVYYLPGTTGWATFSAYTGLSTVLWNPQTQTADANFGLQNGNFGFSVTGVSNLPVAIQGTTGPANSVWGVLTNVSLTNGAFHFSDGDWSNYPARFYRLGVPATAE